MRNSTENYRVNEQIKILDCDHNPDVREEYRKLSCKRTNDNLRLKVI